MPSRPSRSALTALVAVALTGGTLSAAQAGTQRHAAHRGPAVFDVGAAVTTLSPRYYPQGAPFPSPVPSSCALRTPPGTTPQAYFDGVRHFAFEDPFRVNPGRPRDEWDPGDPTSGRAPEPYCKLDPTPFEVPEYGHVVNPAARYEGIYLAGGDGLNRTAEIPESALPGHDSRDNPTAQALVIGRGRTRIALVTVDSIGTFDSDFDRVRHQVAADRPDLRTMTIVLSSTHDESAPDPIGIWGPGQTTAGVNHLYMDFFVRQTARAIELAADAARPAHIRFAETRDPSNFLPCFSSYPFLADRVVRVMQAVALDGRTVATLVNYGMHDELLGFSGEPKPGVAWQPPDRANPLGYYRRVIGGDAQGEVRTHLEDIFGGVGIGMPTAIGSVEMPVVFPPGTPVSRTPLFDANGVPRKVEVDKSYYGDCGRSAYPLPATRPMTIDQLTRATLVGRFLAEDAAAAIERAPFTSDRTLTSAVSPDLFVSLTNDSLFLAAGNAGLFPDRPVYTGGPQDGGPAMPTGAVGDGIETRVRDVRIGDAELVTLPGETFPQTTIRGFLGPEQMAFAQEPVTPWVTALMSARYRFLDGLAEDMIGYLMPPGNFVGDCEQDDGNGQCVLPEATSQPWLSWEMSGHGGDDRFGEHHSDDSESVGPFADLTVTDALAQLLAAHPNRRATIRDGRWVSADGRRWRSPLHSPVAVWVSGLGLVGLPGATLPAGWHPAVVARSLIDHDGWPQTGPDESTAGVLLPSGERVYVSVYDDVG